MGLYMPTGEVSCTGLYISTAITTFEVACMGLYMSTYISTFEVACTDFVFPRISRLLK